MLNPNIEMLENLISAAVSTRYKEVPPTEEEFLTLAQSMRATLSTLPVTDEEFAEILVRLRASIVIQMDVGVYINDRKQRCTRGYKRYKETSGLIERKKCQIFHSIFT